MELSAIAALPTSYGVFQIQGVRFADMSRSVDGHLIVFKGAIAGGTNVPLRIHSSCATGEALGSLRCDCSQQLAASLAFFETEGVGMDWHSNAIETGGRTGDDFTELPRNGFLAG